MGNEISTSTDKRSLLLEFYKTTLEHRTKLASIIMVSGVAVAIPAAVEAYKARLEAYAKDRSLEIEKVIKERETNLRDKEQKLKELEFRQHSIETFSSTGLQQDIELRIRLAEYFAALSDQDYSAKWDAYRTSLTTRRENSKKLLDELYDQIDVEEAKDRPDVLGLRKLYRAKRWLEAEFNPVQPSEKVTLRPGAAQLPTNEGLVPLKIETLISLFGHPLKNMNALTRSCQESDNALLRSQMKTESLSIGIVTMLEPALASLKEVLGRIAKRDKNLAQAIKSFAGLCVRSAVGPGGISRHAFGIAIDLGIRGSVDLSPNTRDDYLVVAEEFHNAGWVWGGAWEGIKDPPHFEISQAMFDQWMDSGKIKVAKQ